MSTTKKYIESFTHQLAEGLKLGQSLDLVRPGSDIRNIVIAGMGGSGIGANLVESLTFGRIPIPISVCKTYNSLSLSARIRCLSLARIVAIPKKRSRL
jgi:glucose/mannose-6-phosphate isomerase